MTYILLVWLYWWGGYNGGVTMVVA
jgi:hypothetical protein